MKNNVISLSVRNHRHEWRGKRLFLLKTLKRPSLCKYSVWFLKFCSRIDFMLLDILSNQNKICEINYKMINSISQNNDFRPRKDPKTNTAKLTNAGKKVWLDKKKRFFPEERIERIPDYIKRTHDVDIKQSIAMKTQLPKNGSHTTSELLIRQDFIKGASASAKHYMRQFNINFSTSPTTIQANCNTHYNTVNFMLLKPEDCGTPKGHCKYCSNRKQSKTLNITKFLHSSAQIFSYHFKTWIQTSSHSGSTVFIPLIFLAKIVSKNICFHFFWELTQFNEALNNTLFFSFSQPCRFMSKTASSTRCSNSKRFLGCVLL